MRVFDNKNQGPGESLNFGIANAKGRYLCFIDQDDMYKPEYLEKMYNSITKYNTDFALCYGRYFNQEQNFEKRINYRYYHEYKYNLITKESKKEIFFSFIPQWTKIVKKIF